MNARDSSEPIVKEKVCSKPIKASSFRIGHYRRLVQYGFLAVVLWIGVEFSLFVSQLEAGKIPTISRPPGVEGFLPISALISLKYWLVTGVVNTIHPAALVIFLIAIATAVILKKGFCSWVCPVGLLSEYLAKLRSWLSHMLRSAKADPKHATSFSLPRGLDYALRGIKYLLLAFFLWAVLVQMDPITLERFINSPYNRLADIKMGLFFARMSSLTFWVLLSLIILSIVIPYFWCRYLCPYGALLGSLSWLSLFKIHRNIPTCIDCDKCTKVCPASINVAKVRTVYSDECHGCLQCIDACPVKDTLYLSATSNNWKLSRLTYALLIVLFFLLGTGIARMTGHWQNQISGQEYLERIPNVDEPMYQHNRGQVPDYDK
jgi:polyferredoxin